jgi:uncharacterized protein with HEPN domain
LPTDKDREIEWLHYIEARIALIHEFVGDRDAAALEKDRKSLYAVKAALIEMSEAIRRLDPATLARHPDIDWRSAADLRNFFTHEYHRVRTDMVLNTVREKLPAVARAIAAEIARRARPKRRSPNRRRAAKS